MEPSQANEIERLIQAGRRGEARQLLNSIQNPNLRDPVLWVLVGRLAENATAREDALRKVFELSENIDLGNWALKELSALAEDGESHVVGPPPPSSLEVARTELPTLRTPLSVRMIRLGLVVFFLGILGVYLVSRLMSAGLDLMHTGAFYLFGPIMLSGVLTITSGIAALVGVCLVVIGFIVPFLPRRKR